MTCPALDHDTLLAYNRTRNPCRCPAAREAHRKDWQIRRLEHLRGHRRQLPAIGTHRRIQALQAIGWPVPVIARRMGVSAQAVYQMFERRELNRRNVEKVKAIFEELCMTPGPSAQTAAHARRRGYPVPLAWDDDIDDPSAQPWRPGPQAVGRPQRDVAGEYLHLSGLGESFEQIAAQLGLQPQSLQRTLERYGVGA